MKSHHAKKEPLEKRTMDSMKMGKSSWISRLFRFLYRLVSCIGFEVLKVIKGIYDGERWLSARMEQWLGPVVQRFTALVTRKIRSAGRAVLRPFRASARGARMIRNNVSGAYKVSFRSAVDAFFVTLWRSLRHNSWFFKSLLNYAAPVLGAAVFALAVWKYNQLPVAVAVEYNGQKLGYVADETTYEVAEREFQQRIVYEDGHTKIDTIPHFTLEIVDEPNLLEGDQLVDRLVELSSEDVVEANGVYIDGAFLGAVTDTASIEQAVDELLAPYQTGKPGETIELVRPVELKEGLYLKSSLTQENKIVDLLHSEVAGEKLYTVKAGDTPSGVAKQNGISYADFKALNPTCEKNFFVGQQVFISKSEPYMAVRVIRRETYRKETMYQTETVKDSKQSITYSKVTQKGVKGITEYTADVQYINGQEVGRNVISSKVVQKTVNERIVKGTRVSSGGGYYTSYGSGELGNLKFRDPLNGGQVVGRYGTRRSKTHVHRGIDIAAPKGTPIYASEDGIVAVSKSGYYTYGKCVVIEHGNGWQTLYAHASKLLVEPGQEVKKGQVIALVGSTGRSTANHLHFEIHRNGSRINPSPYIGR